MEVHRRTAGCTIVGLAGGVAAGKTTFARDLSRELCALGLDTDVVSTDGFLLPNRELTARGLADRKGFPESYDHSSINGFLDAMREGSATEVPVHDHHLHDIMEETMTVVPHHVVIFEGVNALQFADRCDLAIYLHAEPDDLRTTFLVRISGLREAARTEYSPFFDAWTDVPDEVFLAMADEVWTTVNLRNLYDHIEPTSANADLVVHRGADHSIRSVDRRSN